MTDYKVGYKPHPEDSDLVMVIVNGVHTGNIPVSYWVKLGKPGEADLDENDEVSKDYRDQRTEMAMKDLLSRFEHVSVKPGIYLFGGCGCMIYDGADGYLDVYVPEVGCDVLYSLEHKLLREYKWLRAEADGQAWWTHLKSVNDLLNELEA